MSDAKQSNALLIIDAQKAFERLEQDGAVPNDAAAKTGIATLLEAYRAADLPVIHVRHASLDPHSYFQPHLPGFEVMEVARERPGEAVVIKHVNSAFIGTELEAILHDRGVGSLTIVGATLNHCVETTTRMAANLGFRVRLVADATWTYPVQSLDGVTFPASLVHSMSLANLNGEFAEIVTTNDVVGLFAARPPTSPDGTPDARDRRSASFAR